MSDDNRRDRDLGPAADDPTSFPYGGHAGPVLALAVTPDGREIVSAGDDGALVAWDRVNGRAHLRLTGRAGPLFSLAVTPDGREIVSGGDGIVVMLDRASGTQRVRLTGHSGPVRALAVTPDGREIVSGGADGTLATWDRASGTQRALLTEHSGQIRALAVTPDGREIVSGGADGALVVWDRASGEVRVRLTGHSGPVRALAVTPDGREIVSGGGDGVVMVWNRASGDERVRLTGHRGPVLSLAVTPDGREIVSGGRDGTLVMWDRSSGDERVRLTGHRGPVRALAITVDGREIVTGGADGTLVMWDRSSGEERVPPAGHAGPVLSLVVTSDGREIVSGGHDGTLVVWDRSSGEARVRLNGHRGPVNALSATPDGREIVSGGHDGTLVVWDRSSGEERVRLNGHRGPVNALSVTPDGREIVSGGEDCTLAVWDRASGEERDRLTRYAGPVLSVVVAPDNREIVSGDDDDTLAVWDRSSGAQRMWLTGRGGQVRALAITPDGREIVSGGEDGTLAVWDRSSGDERARLKGHRGPVRALAVTPGGREIVSGGEDGTLAVWDRSNGAERVRLTASAGPVRALAVTPDGREIVSGGEDGTLAVWDRATGRPVRGTFVRDPGRTSTALADIDSDKPSNADLLDIGSEVRTMAELAAALSTDPSIAIALLGDWGTGKSTFLLQMQAEIEALSNLSRGRPTQSAFVANPCQVTFNAWHYSDDHVWTGIADRLFRVLEARLRTRSDEAAHPASDSARAATVQHALARAEARRDRLQRAMADGKAGRPLTMRLTGLFGAVTRETASSLWAHPRRAVVPAVVTALALFGLVAALVWRPVVGTLPAVVLALTVARSARRVHGSGSSVADYLYGKVSTARAEEQRRVAELSAELALVDATVRLHRFVADRSVARDYESYRGLLSLVHRDLETLQRDLQDALAQWAHVSGETLAPPIDRIIVYIDDLDRCAPGRVVEVLAAVHLLLAIPLFVVVVAVDPRWLRASLEQHFRELLHYDNEVDAPQLGAPTPLDYLDKIFQVPYALRPMGDRAATYLRALLPPDAISSPEQRPPSSPTLPERDEDDGPSPTPGPVAPDRSPQRGDTAHSDGQLELERASLAPAVAPARNLQPEGLRFHQAERDFIPSLGLLLPTPRAAKKLVNLYRLVRISLEDGRLDAFIGTEEYKAVLLLLALLIGYPTIARSLLVALPSTTERNLSRLLDIVLADVDVESASAPTVERAALLDALVPHRAAAGSPLALGIDGYRKWAPVVSRFSFHTYDLVSDPTSARR